MRFVALILAFLTAMVAQAQADRATFLDLARLGWNYELRTTMIGRDMAIPVHINGRDLAGASLCIVGDKPNADSMETIDMFRMLLHEVYGKPTTMRHAGPDARGCGSGRTVVLRLYSGWPPNRDLTTDLRWMDQTYDLGLPSKRGYAASSPAMAQTFFGKRGQGTHIMVQQAPAAGPHDPLQKIYYRSILIEELFQSFTFGMDILLFDRSAPFHSKLQEMPTDLRRYLWDSPEFMQALVKSNPTGLCAFDILMLYAVARAPVDQTTEPEFVRYIDTHFDDLERDAQITLSDPRYASIMAPGCVGTAP